MQTRRILAGLRSLLLFTTAGCFIASMFTAALGDIDNTLFSIGTGCVGLLCYYISDPGA